MNSLSELKTKLVESGHDIFLFNGWCVESSAGRFTLAMEQVYCNGGKVTSKELKQIISEPKRRDAPRTKYVRDLDERDLTPTNRYTSNKGKN